MTAALHYIVDKTGRLGRRKTCRKQPPNPKSLATFSPVTHAVVTDSRQSVAINVLTLMLLVANLANTK